MRLPNDNDNAVLTDDLSSAFYVPPNVRPIKRHHTEMVNL